jgi:hypothetical protein
VAELRFGFWTRLLDSVYVDRIVFTSRSGTVMDNDSPPDLSKNWKERLKHVRRSNERSYVRGMTRPPRDPVDRELLRKICREGPF